MSSSLPKDSDALSSVRRILANASYIGRALLAFSKLDIPIKRTDSANSSTFHPNPNGVCAYCHHKTPWWKILLEVGMLFVTTGAFVAAAYYAHIAHEQFRGDRPCLGASLNVEHMNIGEQGTAQLIFNNSGRSPAKVTNSNIQAGCYAKFPDPEKVYAKGGTTA
jgi:hypothetical protein